LLKSYPNSVTVVVRNSNCRVVQYLLSRGIEGVFKRVRVGDIVSSHLIQVSRKVQPGEITIPDATVYRVGRNFVWVDSPAAMPVRFSQKAQQYRWK